MSVDSAALDPPAVPEDGANEPKYGGYSRFELELEVCQPPASGLPPSRQLTFRQFVQSLANPQYLNYLASRKFLTNPAFIAYLDYLQYWTRPPYLKYLTFPTATLKMLELLQQEKFRQDIISPDLAMALFSEGMKTAVEWHREG
jgi:mediator of RNA polymerase II transcription subunit 31